MSLHSGKRGPGRLLTRNRSDTIEDVAKSLEGLVEGCEVLDFPQMRHDFSDTKIYWRKIEVEGAKVEADKVEDSMVESAKVGGEKVEGEKVEEVKVDAEKVADDKVEAEKVESEKVDEEKVANTE